MTAGTPQIRGVARPVAGLDVGQLRAAIQEEYALVALEPERGFHFHTGRQLARLLGYEEEWLEGIPAASIASLAGTGNPFRLDALGRGERVVDVGCGAGLDSLIATRMVAPGGLEAELEATVVAAGFVDFAITWRADVFSGAPQASSAAKFGTVGINFRARKALDEAEWMRAIQALSCDAEAAI
jgi:hypothetical protein